jgi:hypothetical protein
MIQKNVLIKKRDCQKSVLIASEWLAVQVVFAQICDDVLKACPYCHSQQQEVEWGLNSGVLPRATPSLMQRASHADVHDDSSSSTSPLPLSSFIQSNLPPGTCTHK